MKKIPMLILACALLLSSCTQTNSKENEDIVEEIVETEETFDLMDDSKIETAHLLLVPALFKMKLENSPGITLFDIRTPEELAENGSIEGAVNVNYYDTKVFDETINAMDKELPVMLYCRSGGRSGEAAAKLKELGFKQVYDLNGGYNAWLAEFPNK